MRPSWLLSGWSLPAWLLIMVMLAPAAGGAADPSALWNIVHGKCVPHEQAAADPSPCAAVDLTHGVGGGFAALKDLVGIAQFLLIPTARISGIEDPTILAPDATNYWQAAWEARHFLEERLHATVPRDVVSLTINSVLARSQNQLHIHIDCVRPDIRDILAASLDKIGTNWAPFPALLAGHTYRSIRIDQETLDDIDPFRMIADAGAKDEMGIHTLALIGTTFADGTKGFVLLDDHADPLAGDLAHAEELQDHTCALATK
jgi:CDP-diacylglycerol pyrophosphatase